MKVMEKNVMRLVAVQQLRSAYGIKTKNWNKNKAPSCKSTTSTSTKVFGVSLDSLPYYNMECGSVPSFLVDSCMKLLAHVDTEGLFRKSGSVVRLKALRAKLDAGEDCLSTALPCDVAGLVKQFFRELPEPVLSAELQDAFLKAQQLPTEQDRTSATMLLSCVLPDRNISTLRHFFDFLHNVSQRSAENKMDSSNLSVILAPNLLHSGEGAEKMNTNTEKRLRLQAAIVHCFIENAHNFGVLPQFLQDRVPSLMGCEMGALSPSRNEKEDLEFNSGMKKKHRRSFGDVVSGALTKIKTNRTPTNATQADSAVFSSATPVIATPSSKRKLPFESGHSFGFSNKKRRSVKKTLGIELLPNALFTGTLTPGSAQNTSGVLDSSQSTLLSAERSKRQTAPSSRRKSKRLSNRHIVNRAESGKTGCFSPKVGKREAPRKSLRLRFSLGKSGKDAGSESIGWRLATQESTICFPSTKETEFTSSVVARKTESKCSKYISQSEDNLLTPQCDSSAHQTSWSGETPVGAQAFSGRSFTDTPMNMCRRNNYMSEPAIVGSKSPGGASLSMKLCCASSAESLESERSITKSQTSPTLLEVSKAITGAETVQDGIEDSRSTTLPMSPTANFFSMDADPSSFATRQRLNNEQNITSCQVEFAALTPLHIDSIVFDSSVDQSPSNNEGDAALFDSHNCSLVGAAVKEAVQLNSSRLINALDIQSPARFQQGVSSGLQSTPHKPNTELRNDLASPSNTCTVVFKLHEKAESLPEIGTKVGNQACNQEAEKRRVADHIQHFNKLTLYSPTGPKSKQIRSPLKFHRTPVRQTVRRINSLLGESRRPGRKAELTPCQSRHVAKAVSLESGLSPHPQLQPRQGLSDSTVKIPPPVPPKMPSTLARKPKSCALGDMTNKIKPKNITDCPASHPSGATKPFMEQVAEKDMSHYRGSPRNPISQGKLLSATKPIDL